MKSKIKILIIFILGIIGLGSLHTAFAEPSVVQSSIDNMSNKYANNLLRVKLVKTTDNKINLILHTTKTFDNKIYPIKKSDFEYIVLLPETYHSITSKPDFTDLMEEIRDVQINLVPYIGIKTNNGYTKVVIQTKKRDVDLIVSNESLELAKVIDKDLDKVLDDKAKASLEKTLDNITPVPLDKPVAQKTVNVSTKAKTTPKRVVKTYRKPAKKVTKTPAKKVSNPIQEPKKVIEISKTQKAEQPSRQETSPQVKANTQEKVQQTPTRQVVQKQMTQKRVQSPRPKPKKQSPLAGLLGNKWLYIIGVPLLLILLALKNIQKAAMNQPSHDIYQNYDEQEYYSQEEDIEDFNEEQEDSSDNRIFGGLKREIREPVQEKSDYQEDIEIEEDQEIYQAQEEPQEELLYEESDVLLDEESQVEVLTPEVAGSSQEEELEEILPDELEEISLEEEIPLEDRVSEEEFDVLMEENQEEEFNLDEQNELFEDIEVEEEFSLDEQEDLFEDIDVKEEVLLDPEIVAKAFDEVKTRTLQEQAPALAVLEPEVEVEQQIQQVSLATSPVLEPVNPIQEQHIEDEFAATMAMQGLNVLDSKRVDLNKGFYLVEMNNQKALIGFINNEYDVLHRFTKDVVGELRIKKTEEKPDADIYLVEAKPWKALVSVSETAIKTKLIL